MNFNNIFVLFFSFSFFPIPEAAKREGVKITGTTTAPGSFVRVNAKFSAMCPPESVALANGQLCCYSLRRSNDSSCPYSPDGKVIRQNDPPGCCPLNDTVACQDRVRGCSAKGLFPVKIQLWPSSVQVSTVSNNNTNDYSGRFAIDGSVSVSSVGFWQSAVVNGYEWLQVYLGSVYRISYVKVQDRMDGFWSDYTNVEVRVGRYDHRIFTYPGQPILMNIGCDIAQSYGGDSITSYYYICDNLHGKFVSVQKLAPGTFSINELSVFGTVYEDKSFCPVGYVAFSSGHLCCSTFQRAATCSLSMGLPNLLQYSDPANCCSSSNTIPCPNQGIECTSAWESIDISQSSADASSVYQNLPQQNGASNAFDGIWSYSSLTSTYWMSGGSSADYPWLQLHTAGINRVSMVAVVDVRANWTVYSRYTNVEVRVGFADVRQYASYGNIITVNTICDVPKSYNNDMKTVYFYLCANNGTGGIVGNYVTIQRKQKDFLNFQEIYLFGIADVWEYLDTYPATAYATSNWQNSPYISGAANAIDGFFWVDAVRFYSSNGLTKDYLMVTLPRSYTIMMIKVQNRVDNGGGFLSRYNMIEVRVGNTNVSASTTLGQSITVNTPCGSPQTYQNDKRSWYFYSCGQSGIFGQYVTVQRLVVAYDAYFDVDELYIYALVEGYTKCKSGYMPFNSGKLCCSSPYQESNVNCPANPYHNLLQWNDPPACCLIANTIPCPDQVNGCAAPLKRPDLNQTIPARSSVYQNSATFESHGAVDGICSDGSNAWFFISQSLINQWIMFKLNAPATIFAVRVQGRVDCCNGRYNTVEVRVGNANVATLTNPLQPFTLNSVCGAPMTSDGSGFELYDYICPGLIGQFISVQRNAATANYLQITEIYVLIM